MNFTFTVSSFEAWRTVKSGRLDFMKSLCMCVSRGALKRCIAALSPTPPPSSFSVQHYVNFSFTVYSCEPQSTVTSVRLDFMMSLLCMCSLRVALKRCTLSPPPLPLLCVQHHVNFTFTVYSFEARSTVTSVRLDVIHWVTRSSVPTWGCFTFTQTYWN